MMHHNIRLLPSRTRRTIGILQSRRVVLQGISVSRATITSSTSKSSSIEMSTTEHHNHHQFLTPAPPLQRLPNINFTDSASAHGSKSTFELLRAIAVFKLCQVPFLVKHAESLLNLSSKILGNTITNGLVKHTFFKHFCAGEDSIDMKPVIDLLQEHNIGPILDYAAENEESSSFENENEEGMFICAQDMYMF